MSEALSGSARDLDTAERLVRLETKLDILIKSLENPNPGPQFIAKFDSLEKRLNTLERWHNMTIGALVVLNLIVTFMADKIKGLL